MSSCENCPFNKKCKIPQECVKCLDPIIDALLQRADPKSCTQELAGTEIKNLHDHSINTDLVPR